MLKVVSTKLPERDAILSAALQTVARCGLRHTSLDEIAKEAGLSRAALRAHFKNKATLLRVLLQRLNEQALAAAATAARRDAPLAARLEDVLGARTETFLGMARSAERGIELLEEDRGLGRDISATYRRRHLGLLQRVLEAAARDEGLAFAQQGTTVREVATLLFDFSNALEPAPERKSAAARRVRTLTRIVVSGLRRNSASASAH